LEGKLGNAPGDSKILTEADFKAVPPGQTQAKEFGKFRLISGAKGMPLQVVDSAGLRVCELPKEYLALIPAALQQHIEEFGLIVQIPLPLACLTLMPAPLPET